MLNDTRLPLDLLMICDVEDLENALLCQYAIIHEGEIFFSKDDKEVANLKDELELGEEYEEIPLDSIESDRIQAVIDLLNFAEENPYISHLIDRLVR